MFFIIVIVYVDVAGVQAWIHMRDRGSSVDPYERPGIWTPYDLSEVESCMTV